MTYKTNCFGCLIEMELEDRHPPECPALRQLDRMALRICESCSRSGPKILPLNDNIQVPFQNDDS